MSANALLYVCFVLFASISGKFVPQCNERCDEDDFKRSHPPNVVDENIALEATAMEQQKLHV